ncbi:SAICAR synthetase, partial [Aphelenchoides avenae]
REGCVLVDLKIEFGVNTKGEVVLADVIDNDSWRVWPNGDRRLQLDKQFYRDLPEVTDEALKELKKNYEKVADLTAHFVKSAKSTRVVIVMGSAADKDYSTKIAKETERYGVGHVHLHVCSAHKSTAEALRLIAKYEGEQGRLHRFTDAASFRRRRSDGVRRGRWSLQRSRARDLGKHDARCDQRAAVWCRLGRPGRVEFAAYAFGHRLHDCARPRGSRSGRGEDSQHRGPSDLREDSRRSVQQRPQDLRRRKGHRDEV